MENETNTSQSRRKFSFADVHQRVLTQYAPLSLIVNQDSDIVHMSSHVGRFLQHVGGEPSRTLTTLVYPELRLELRTALFQAWQSGKSVEARKVQIKREGKTYYVNMTARPFHDDEASADFVLVLFDEVKQTMADEMEKSAGKNNNVLTQLEGELYRTKEHLQETIEQSEVSTEELKASNEELQATNEELRLLLKNSKQVRKNFNRILVAVLPRIAPSYIDMYEQGTADKTKGGLGIGLALVKQIVELHGGQINATSEGLGKGSTFTVLIPLQHRPIMPLSHSHSDNQDKLKDLKMLLIDDMEDVSQVLKCYLN